MKIKIYCYSGCGTCKKALKYLDEKGVAYDLIPIREKPPTPAELKKMLQYQGGNIRKLFNTSSKDYKDGDFKNRLSGMTIQEAIGVLHRTGNLVKRPFVIGEQFGLVGFVPEHWDSVLS